MHKRHLFEIYVGSDGEEGEAQRVLDQCEHLIVGGRVPDAELETGMDTGKLSIFYVSLDKTLYTVAYGDPEPWVFRGRIHPAYVLVYNAVWSHEGDMEWGGQPCDSPKNADELHEDLGYWAEHGWGVSWNEAGAVYGDSQKKE